MTIDEAHYEALVRGIATGGRWIAAHNVLVAASRQAVQLRDLGAAEVLAIAATRGTGPVADDLPTIDLAVSATSMMDSIRQGERALDALPADVVARIDAWDPERSARVVRALFSAGQPVAGRTVFGARDPSWMALEDKTVVDAVWDAAAVARAPSEVVRLDAPDALREATRRLDAGAGTVWAGDNRSGWHGGASFTRWVRTDDEARLTANWLGNACDTVRIMPFLDGIPCSIHGWVFPNAVVTLRPCEMIVFRRGEDSAFAYAAAGTFWDPPAADRQQMRDAARRVGRYLRASLGYRGVFTIDGVMARDGFRPTELNPRFGAAIGVMAAGMRLPLYLLHLAVVEGLHLDYQPEALERLLVANADGRRSGRAGIITPRRVEPVEARLVLHGGEVREADEDEPADAVLAAGPSMSGTYVNVVLDPERTPRGPSVAPRAAAFLTWADRRYGLGLGPIEPAPDVRPGP